MLGQLVAVLGEQVGEDVAAVEPHRPDPRQVVEADLVDEDPLRLDAEHPGDRALEADGDVAEADRAVAGVEQRARDDADRVREVDDPRARRGTLRGALGDLEHDRHRAHRLREAAGPGRLLADAAAAQRHRLVVQPRLLPADADLEQDERRSVERAVEVLGEHEPALVVLAREHAPREPADDVEPLAVDVVQRELVHRQPRQVRDELGRVRRARADDVELHPLTPVSVTPSTKARCARKKSTITGAITSSVAAIVRFHCTWWSERNSERPIESTQWCALSPV